VARDSKEEISKKQNTCTSTKEKGDSQFWSGLMEVKSMFLERGRFMVQDGTQTRFWEDLWVRNEPLMKSFPSLYIIARKKNVTVAQVLSTVPLNISFRRAVDGENRVNWLKLVGCILGVRLNRQRHTFVWNRSKSFSVRAMHSDIMTREGVPFDTSSWKIKVTLKIKIFQWYLRKGEVLTKDNLAKRKWKGGVECCVCGQYETIQHLFFDCPIAMQVWSTVSITFDIKKPRSMNDIFGAWIKSFSVKQRKHVLLGVAAVC
jgi:hypothetical protein